MSTPKKIRDDLPWHGGCSEVVCIDKAINAGVDPRGGKMKTVNIGDKFGKSHKELLAQAVKILKIFLILVIKWVL